MQFTKKKSHQDVWSLKVFFFAALVILRSSSIVLLMWVSWFSTSSLSTSTGIPFLLQSCWYMFQQQDLTRVISKFFAAALAFIRPTIVSQRNAWALARSCLPWRVANLLLRSTSICPFASVMCCYQEKKLTSIICILLLKYMGHFMGDLQSKFFFRRNIFFCLFTSKIIDTYFFVSLQQKSSISISFASILHCVHKTSSGLKIFNFSSIEDETRRKFFFFAFFHYDFLY